MSLVRFCSVTGRFVSDLVGNSEDRFTPEDAHKVPRKQTTKLRLQNFQKLSIRTVLGLDGKHCRSRRDGS